MKTKILMLIVFLLAIRTTDAQIMFQRHYGGNADDAGNSVLQAVDGGYIVAGRTMSYGNGSNDIYVLKTDALGNESWSKTYGGIGWDAPLGVKKTYDNCYVIVGGTSSFGAGGSDAFLMKIDNDGDSLWFRTYGGSADDEGFGVDICEDSGYIISGATCSFADAFAAAYLIRTNYHGDTLWTRIYEKKDFNGANSVIKTNEDGFLLVGVAETGGAPGADGLTIKTNSVGDSMWMKTFGGSSYDEFYSICEDNNGNYLMCGTTYNLVNGSYDIYVTKITVNGEMIWSRSFGGAGSDNSYSMIQTSDNNYVIAGSTESFGAGGKDVYLIKINSDGDTIWTRTFGGASDDWAKSIQETVDGGYIISGYTHSFGGNYDVYLIKTDANGFSGFEKIISLRETLKVFPNPSNGLFRIQFQDIYNKNAEIEIYNLFGQIVYKKYLPNQTIDYYEVDIRNNPKGVYILSFKNRNSFKTCKIIIN